MGFSSDRKVKNGIRANGFYINIFYLFVHRNLKTKYIKNPLDPDKTGKEFFLINESKRFTNIFKYSQYVWYVFGLTIESSNRQQRYVVFILQLSKVIRSESNVIKFRVKYTNSTTQWGKGGGENNR